MRQQLQQQDLVAQLRDEEALRGVQAEVVGLLDELEQERARLSPTTEPEWLINQVVRLTDAADIRVTTIAPESPQPVDGFTRLTVAVDLVATYHALGTLLDYLEQTPSLLHVDRLEVDRGSADAPTDGEALSFRLTVSTLHLAPLVARAR